MTPGRCTPSGSRQRADPPATALYYARGRPARAAQVARVSTTEARHPDLLVGAQGLLHLVWSGGEAGQVFYSTKAGEAAMAGWSAPRTLPPPEWDWPRLGVDAARTAYRRLRGAPAAAARGLRGAVAGWRRILVAAGSRFDAQAAGWAMVDHPALAVPARCTLPGPGPVCREPMRPGGIYYASAPPDAAISGPPAVGVSPVAPGRGRVRLAAAAWVRGDLHLLMPGAEGGAHCSSWARRLFSLSQELGERVGRGQVLRPHRLEAPCRAPAAKIWPCPWG